MPAAQVSRTRRRRAPIFYAVLGLALACAALLLSNPIALASVALAVACAGVLAGAARSRRLGALRPRLRPSVSAPAQISRT